jgi:hypothetical protein
VTKKNDPVRNSRWIVLLLQHSLVGITAGTSPDSVRMFNPLNTKRGLLYLKTQLVPRSKHFSYGL